jgi:tetratricopeptide (TPR) repeat protein
MGDRSIVFLSVRETGTAAFRCYSFCLTVNGQVLMERCLSPVESGELRGITSQYQMLFEKSCQPEIPENYLEILGSGLFHLIFEDVWEKMIKLASGGNIFLAIVSDVSEILLLPWEITKPPGRDLLGFDQNFSILRLPQMISSLPASKGQVPPGPLRVLFAACAPGQSMDYLAEEEAFGRALDGLDLAWDSCDGATLEELRRKIELLRPQIVHLVGQAIQKDGSSYFAFEGKDGIADLRSAKEILQAIPGVRCNILCGCRSKGHLLADLCRDMAMDGLPLAVAWAGTPSNGVSSIRALYRGLASGQTIHNSLASMRQAIQEVYKHDTAFLDFPTIYSTAEQDMIFDPQLTPISMPPARCSQPPLPGTTEGYTADFVGRRRDLQRLVPALREGRIKAAVITGPLGSGKSTLAVRLARELEAYGFLAVPLPSSLHRPLSAARVLETLSSVHQHLAAQYLKLGKNEIAQELQLAGAGLKNPSSLLEERFKQSFASLNLSSSRILLVLDSFEAVLDQFGRIEDPDVARFYRLLLSELDSSRAIIVSERLPEDVMTLPKKAWHHALGGLSRAEFLRFFSRDAAIAEHLRSGHFGRQMLLQLFETTMGLPTCMGRMAKVLEDDSIATSTAISQADEPLTRSLCDDFTDRLYQSLSPAAKDALIRAAVYSIPISSAGLEAVTRESQEVLAPLITEWTDRGLTFQTPKGLLAITKAVGLWLTANLKPLDFKKAHQAAGDFLQDIITNAENLDFSRLDCALEARAHYLAADEDEKAEEVTARISSILMNRGLYNETKKLNQELLERSMHPGPMRWLARAFLEQGDFQTAQEWYLKCLKFPGRSEEDSADSWYGVALASLGQENYEQSMENFRKALEAYIHLNNKTGQVAALQGLASAQMAKGERESALISLKKALEIQQEMGDLRSQAVTLQNLSSIELRLKKQDAAREKLVELASIFRKLNLAAKEATALYDLGSLDLEKEDFDSAKEELSKAYDIRQQMGDRAGQAAALHNLAMIDSQRGDIDSAKDKFERALQIYQETKDKPGEAAAFFQLGALAVQLNRIPEGLRLMALSAMILRSANSPEVRNVEPVVERLASQIKYSQDQFMKMIQEANSGYRKDRGRGLIEGALGSIDKK